MAHFSPSSHADEHRTIRTRLSDLERLERSYRTIPFEAILKQDILRLGLSFDPDAVSENGDYKQKDYFIFSFDHVALQDQDQKIRFRAPEEIRLSGGLFQLLPTVISVRISPASPYRVSLQDGVPHLFLDGTDLGSVEYPPIPTYYSHTTKEGKKPGEIAPVIEWGYLIYLTVFRNCQYFGKDEECAFCDINHNYRQQRDAGRPYTGVKSLEEILEVLSWIDTEYQDAKVYTITGGSVVASLKNKNEVDFYLEYARAIEENFPGRWLGKMVTQAWPIKDVKKLYESGIRVYHPNYEIWDEKLFPKICPGKERFVGRSEWMKRILDSVDVFGPSHVIPNFVGGVELAKPYGYEKVSGAIDSTSRGLDHFMSHGVLPRFTAWCPEPHSELGYQEPPPLEYFTELLAVWKATFEHHKLPSPPGYGEPGRGKAVFSVSAFMDVIGYEGRN